MNVKEGVRRGDGKLPPAIAAPLDRSWSEAEAFAYCSALTKGHYENFPVGSFLVPPALQPAIHSLYAFMRTADDFSDEKRMPGDDQERLAYLEAWDQLLSECRRGEARHPIFIALRVTLDRYQLPIQWLRDLLTAFKMDCTVRRYRSYDELLNYCRYSANPVGRLILTLFGYRDEERYALSDAVCTGLQLTNHWQDVAIDLRKGRIYLPQEDLQRFGVTEEWLKKQAPPPAPLPQGEGGRRPGEADSFRGLLAFEVERTRGLFKRGRSLPESVAGRLRLELRMTWRGGVRILDKIQAADYDVFRSRPIVTTADWVRIGLQSLIFHA